MTLDVLLSNSVQHVLNGELLCMTDLYPVSCSCTTKQVFQTAFGGVVACQLPETLHEIISYFHNCSHVYLALDRWLDCIIFNCYSHRYRSLLSSVK